MRRYRIEFVDHGGNVFDRRYLDNEDDQAAVDEAHRLHVPGIGAGFNVWQGDRLVHQHRGRG